MKNKIYKEKNPKLFIVLVVKNLFFTFVLFPIIMLEIS